MSNTMPRVCWRKSVPKRRTCSIGPKRARASARAARSTSSSRNSPGRMGRLNSMVPLALRASGEADQHDRVIALDMFEHMVVDDEVVMVARQVEHVLAEVEGLDVETGIAGRIDVERPVIGAAELAQHGAEAAFGREMQDAGLGRQVHMAGHVERRHPGALERAAVGAAHARALGHVREGGAATDVALHGETFALECARPQQNRRGSGPVRRRARRRRGRISGRSRPARSASMCSRSGSARRAGRRVRAPRRPRPRWWRPRVPPSATPGGCAAH